MTLDSVEMTPHKHMLSPSSLLKIIGALARSGGENGTIIIFVSAVYRSWTWHLLHTCLGGDISSRLSLASVGLGDPVWPLIYSSPCHHDLWSLDVKYYQIRCRAADMFKRSWPLHNNNLPLLSHIILIHNILSPSRVDDVGNTMAHLRSRSLPVDFSSLSRKLI